MPIKIPEWSLMINWANIQNQVESVIGIVPDQVSIEMAIEMLQNDMKEEEIYQMEAEDLEQALVNRLLKILRKNKSKEIKLVKKEQKVKQEVRTDPKVDVQVFGPFGNMGSLKDMGLDIDPEMMKNITDQVFGQMMGKKPKKKRDEDEDEEEDDPGASFYM